MLSHKEPTNRLWSDALKGMIVALLIGVFCQEESLNAGEGRVVESEMRPSLSGIGRELFLDTNLSQPVGLACVSCHNPEAAFSDPRRVSPGAKSETEGRRNAPSLMYAALIPALVFEEVRTPGGDIVFAWEGGLFHDGRARDLFEQVQHPIFNPDEMALASPVELANRLRQSEYAEALQSWVGEDEWENDDRLNYIAFRALVHFLQEPLFRPFDARIDDYLSGDVSVLDESEHRGLAVFLGKGKCVDCHLLEPTHWSKPLLSDFGYDNLGVPSRGEKDRGLGEVVDDSSEDGKFRAPTLRNIALTAPYMHNGSIETLREVMDFYNRRSVEPERWMPTDFPETVNHDDMGDLELSSEELDDLLALMNAFTDRSVLDMPKDGRSFPVAPAGTKSSDELRLYFPDWTHRLHPEFEEGL